MSNYKIAVIVGSIRQDSHNKKLALAIEKLAPKEFSFEHVRIDDLPLYNQDHDKNQAEPVLRLKAQVKAADGLLFVTPEYNRSIPGVLKNAIDHGSRPYGQSSWGGKPAGIVGISPGALGTALAQQHLRNVLSALDMITLGQPDAFVQYKEGFFEEGGVIGIEPTRKFLEKWVEKYALWIQAQAGKKA